MNKVTLDKMAVVSFVKQVTA